MDPIRVDTRYTGAGATPEDTGYTPAVTVAQTALAIAVISGLDTGYTLTATGPLNTRLTIATITVDTGYGAEVVATPPVNTVAPVASGTVRIGQVLSCTTGTWTGTPTPTYAYQWRRDGVDIGGATASTHTVVSADMATELDCVVTATNSAGADSEPSNILASPWQPILAARPGVLIWDGLDPQCYGGASVGAPVSELRTVDGIVLASQAITAKQATRTSATLDFDGTDDFYNGNATYADYWGVSQTYVIGVDGLSVGANEFAIDANGGLISPAKQAIIAGSANIVRNVHRSSGDTGAAMLGLATASQDLAVVWVTGTPGSGTLYDLASGVSVANSCAPASLPSRTYTQWSLGGNIAGSVTWQGNLRYLGVDGSAWSAGDLATWRACAVAAGVL